jgi:hypothetical protein
MINTGGEFEEFIRRQNLTKESEELLRNNAIKVLSRTDLLDGQESNNCQLVLGEVQSGKTMSFTSLIALAHQNGFPLVIVLGGTKLVLLSQTTERLRKDLQMSGNGGANPWVLIEKPKDANFHEDLAEIQNALSIWSEPDAPEIFKPTVVITILKHQMSMDAVTNLITNLKSKFNIDKYPVLIIDDEGDQAGLNLDWRTEEESTNYAAIGRLRRSLKRHSYVMYTATPQGPLLINIQDSLSPKYVTVLTSGANYLGGEELFLRSENFTRLIPNLETSLVFNPDLGAPVPPSLKKSLAYYLLALYVAQNRTYPKPLSMLVHPSSTRDLHESYFRWTTSTLNTWYSLLREPEESAYKEEVKDFFLPALEELEKTTQLPSDWDIHEALREIRWWIKKVEIRILNKDYKDIKPTEWLSKAGWILIGGNKLERGFTIENLAVTYMPRPTGGGNSDVIQQRGRFFGYKKNYADLLRGWFFQDHIQAYIDYVDHEKSIREQMIELDSGNLMLSDWRRRFFLDPAYNPVRAQVISLGITHRRLSDFRQTMLYDPKLPGCTDKQLNAVYKLTSNLKPMPGDNRTNRKNYYAEVDIEKALEILIDWEMSTENRLELDDDLWALRKLVDDGKITDARIVLMDWDKDKNEQIIRTRSLPLNVADPNREPDKQIINQLDQGESNDDGVTYAGDSQMKFEETLTIQVHKIEPDYEGQKRGVVAAIAVHVPGNAAGFIVQTDS